MTVAITSFLASIAAANLRGAGVPEPVRIRPGLDEIAPAAAPGLLAWAQNEHGTSSFDMYVRTGAERPIKINPPHTYGYPGGFDGVRLVYQRTHEDDAESDLWIYNTEARTHRRLPRGVNTPDWEWSPSLSGEWMLFGRGRDTGLFHPAEKKVMLRNLATGEERRLARVLGLGAWVVPGQVSGGNAVWTVCDSRAGRVLCESFQHDIQTRTTRRLSSGGAARQFAVSITASGHVFLARGGRKCGENVRLVHMPPESPAVEIVSFARGTEPNKLVAFEDASGTHLYFDRLDCRSDQWDVFRLLVEP